MDELNNQLNKTEIETFYNNVQEIWPSNEPWYKYTKIQIERFVHKYAFKSNDYILNAGSGGYDYNLNCKMHHIDIAAEKIKHLPYHTVTSLERLPISSNTFDGILCVGSVINYCDAIPAIAEMTRVLKTGGVLILEFENSFAYEYLNKPSYKADAQIIQSIYQGVRQQQWIYSYRYIYRILKEYGFKIMSIYRFHVFSALMLHFGESEDDAARYAKFDIVGSYLPCINNHASNFIVRCIKL